MIDCTDCGICCELFLKNLTEEEYRSGKYKTQFEEFGMIDDFVEAETIGANILTQKENGSCIYLKNKKCSIHKTRPKHCREFFCDSKEKKYKEMIKIINAAAR
ncbi:MAG: YkgJ family cysteine cluster protein [archaeon]